MKVLILIAAVSAFALLQGTVALLARPASDDGPYWVLAGPWVDPSEMLIASDGYLAVPRGPLLGFIAHSQTNGLAQRLRDNGAVFVIAASTLKRWGCLAK